MSRLIVFANDKGGSTKTLQAVHTMTYLDALGHNFRAVDLDETIPSLLAKIFPHRTSSINPELSRVHTGSWNLPTLFDQRVLKNQNVLIDCGANTVKAWPKLFLEVRPSLAKELHDAGVQTTVIVPFDGNDKSPSSFKVLREVFDFATVILAPVRNTASQILNLPSHPVELTYEFPLPPLFLYNHYLAEKKSFDEIARYEDPKFAFLRGCAQRYLPTLHRQLDRVREHLVPTPAVQPQPATTTISNS